MSSLALFVSIHAPRTGRDICRGFIQSCDLVSIHAPRTGRDICRGSFFALLFGFNPRAPHGARLLRSAGLTVG